eukprot:1393324-Pleurochrysis_carterae.AAC.1
MSASRSIQIAVTHTLLGVLVGGSIEALLPGFASSASLSTQVFEVLVQVGLNGAALTTVSAYLSEADPTFGIPFSMALYMAQPELAQRISALSSVVKGQVAQGALKMAPRIEVVPQAN